MCVQPASLVRILFSQGQVRALCAHLANILLNLGQTHQTYVLHVARANILLKWVQVHALPVHLANILLNLAQTHQTHVLRVARASILLNWGQMYQMCVQPVSLVRIPLSLG